MEDASFIAPEWRDRFLAASVFWLKEVTRRLAAGQSDAHGARVRVDHRAVQRGSKQGG